MRDLEVTQKLLRWLMAGSSVVWLSATPAHEVPDPKYGGVVAVARHLDFELASHGDTVTLYVEDHGEPVPTEGGRAELTVIEGTLKSEVILIPAAPNRLLGNGAKLKTGAEAVAVVTLPGPRVITVRFTVK